MRRKECVLNGGEIRPQRRNLFTAVRRETNLKCLLLTTLVLASSAATGIWCRDRGPRGSGSAGSDLLAHSLNVSTSPMPTSQALPSSSSSKGISEEGTTVCGEGKVLMPAALILLLYLLYLVECWHSKAREMIARPKLDVNTVYRKVEEMRRARPIVWWQAICYHFERKTQQFTRYRHSDASPSSSHVSCDNERVKTHTANASFYYGRNGLHDISKDLVDLEEFTVTQVQFRKTFIFHDTQSATDFEDQRASFFQDMEELDSYVEMREGMELAKVTTPERMTCWADAEEPPWFGRLDVFWLCSLLLLSWPLRVVLEFNTAHLVYQVTKLFGTNCNCAISSVAKDSDISSPLVERGHVLPDLDRSHSHHQSLQWLPRVLEFCKNKLKTAVNSNWDIYGSRHQNNRISRFDPDPDLDDEKRTLIPTEEQHHQHHEHQCQVNRNTNVFADDDGLPRSVTLMLSSQSTTERFELSEIDRRDSEPFGSRGSHPRGARSRGCPCNCGCGDSGFGISDNYFACPSGGGGDNCSAASTVECDFSLIPSESRALLFMGQSQSENGSDAGVEIGTVGGGGGGGGDGCAVKSRSCEVMTPITCENGLYPHPHSHSYLTCDSSDQSNCELGIKGPAPVPVPASDQDQNQNQHQCQECHAHEEIHFSSAGNPPPRSISASTFNFQRVPRSESFQVLRTSMPRSATGVTIDLTYPVSASFSRDQSIDTTDDTQSSPFQSHTSSHQTQTWTKKLRRSFTHRDFTSVSRSRNGNKSNDSASVKYKEVFTANANSFVGPSSSLLSPSESHHYVSKSKSGHWQWLEDVRPNFPVNRHSQINNETPSLTKSKSATEYNM